MPIKNDESGRADLDSKDQDNYLDSVSNKLSNYIIIAWWHRFLIIIVAICSTYIINLMNKYRMYIIFFLLYYHHYYIRIVNIICPRH